MFQRLLGWLFGQENRETSNLSLENLVTKGTQGVMTMEEYQAKIDKEAGLGPMTVADYCAKIYKNENSVHSTAEFNNLVDWYTKTLGKDFIDENGYLKRDKENKNLLLNQRKYTPDELVQRDYAQIGKDYDINSKEYKQQKMVAELHLKQRKELRTNNNENYWDLISRQEAEMSALKSSFVEQARKREN